MFKDFFSNRLFIGALAFFVLCVVGSLLYLRHVEQQTARELAEAEERVQQWNKRQNPQTTPEAPVVAEPQHRQQDGHVHADGTWHEGPHEAPKAAEVDTSPTVQVSDISVPAPKREYDRGAGNPPPWENVPVDLWDFEATKAAMIENINFVKANWHPFEYNREVSIASAISHNIANAANATDLGLYTPEQALELTMLYSGLLEFKGHEPGRTRELREQGYTHKEAIRIAAEETLQRQKQQWGVKE